MIDLNDLVIFSKVAETNGITPAARLLNMPKSRVSRRMVALETALGVSLIERSTRSVRLTEAGEIFFRHCKRITEEADSAVDSVNRLIEAPRGHLRVSASVTIGQHLLAPHACEFMHTYPDIDLELQLTDRRVDLIAEGFDVVIRVGELTDSTLVSRKLGSSCARLYAAPEYIERFRTPARVTDLQKHELLCRSGAESSGRLTLIGPKNKTIDVEFKSSIYTGDLTTVRQVACDGGGIALLPEYLAKPKVCEQSLINVLPKWQTEAFNIYALYPSHRGITLKARTWIDFVKGKIS